MVVSNSERYATFVSSRRSTTSAHISSVDGPDSWEHIVHIVAEQDSLPDSEVKVIEKAITEAYPWLVGRPAAVDLVRDRQRHDRRQ